MNEQTRSYDNDNNRYRKSVGRIMLVELIERMFNVMYKMEYEIYKREISTYLITI